MKKVLRIFYILIVFTILIFLCYKEHLFIEEIKTLTNEKKDRVELIFKDIDENYQPREEDFYKKKGSKK